MKLKAIVHYVAKWEKGVIRTIDDFKFQFIQLIFGSTL
jgi:hypothetical protein